MLLAIDVGNTNITNAVFENENCIASFRMTTKTPRTSDEYSITINELLKIKGIDVSQIDSVIIASVVPNIMHSLVGGVYKSFGVTPMIVGEGTKTGIRIDIPNPREMGADRVVDAAAGYYLYGGPCIIIDFGTATTYDLVQEDGALTAGITSPGIRICANALWRETSKLPEIEIAKPATILAKDTITSMQAGLVYGYIGQTEYIVERIKKESGLSNVKVVATGGLGKLIYESTDVIDSYDPMLTMKGLQIIYEKTIGRK